MLRSRYPLLAVAVLIAASAAGAVPHQIDGGKITCGDVRFSFLSPTLVRMEYAPEGQFVDEPSVLVLDRDWPPCPLKVTQEDEWLVACTPAMELRWLTGRYTFDDQSLMITWRAGEGSGTWRPGSKHTANLKGTRGALDGIRAGHLPALDDGLLSRDGWTVLDDSRRPLWLGEEKWLAPRPHARARDMYFFAYGQDYAHMLSEYVRLCGPIPMLPRYAWGPWYSRYWAFSADEEKQIVSRFRELDIPLDVLVIDVDWHKYGWEGYDWNEELFPDPKGFLKWVHDQGVYVTANNHPGSALPVEDTHHAPAAKMAGLSGDALNRPLSWRLGDKKLNRAFVEAVHWPLERMGIDFWWIDGNPGSGVPDLNSTMWCAKTYYDGTQRRTGKRSLTFSRYGGLGQHRYPAGFSGDVYSDWDVLNYEIRYTTRAGNVAFPYWSHDIGGFHGNRLDPELYVRWCQFGALSPVLRLHSNHGVREPWEYGEQTLGIVRDYFKLRQRLYPYLNTCQRQVYETGMPLCRALYMHWPRHDEAYEYDYEYMLGPELLVAPITTPGQDGTATKQVWLPPGLWWDYWTGEPVRGPRVMAYQAGPERCPMFARAGAVVPMQSDMDYMGQRPLSPLTLDVWPGASGAINLYEDDGLSLDYQTGAFATTQIRTEQQGDDVQVTIGPRRGTFDGALVKRAYTLRLHGSLKPDQVTVASADEQIDTSAMAPAGRTATALQDDVLWSYDPDTRLAVVDIPAANANRQVKIALKGAGGDPRTIALRAKLLAMCAGAERAAKATQSLGIVTLMSAAVSLRSELGSYVQALADGDIDLEAIERGASEALARTWSTVARSPGAQATREELLKRLVGLTATATVRSFEGGQANTVVVSICSRVPLPGATVANVPVVPEGWLAGKADGRRLAAFGATGGGGLSYDLSVASRLEMPPLGLVEVGADLEVQYAGFTLTLQPRAGLDCSFVQQWHIIGPFPNKDSEGLGTAYPPETEIDLSASYPGLEGPATWKSTDWRHPARATDPAVFVNLEPMFTPKDRALAYAVCYVVSEREQPAKLSIGTDDGCKVWLNGKQVLYHPEPRPPEPGQDVVDVTLRKGLNTVLYKVANESGQWGLYLQVLGPGGKPARGLKTTLSPLAQ